MTFEELKQNLRIWVKDILDTEVIFSHGSGPRPKNQYTVINVGPIEKLIQDVRTETRQGNGDIKADYIGVRKVMVSINIYRDDVEQKMIDLRSSLSKILTQDYFNNLNIGIINSSEIRHIPEQIGKAWENRSQCDFFFHITFSEIDADISEIKEIEITNEINGDLIIIT